MPEDELLDHDSATGATIFINNSGTNCSHTRTCPFSTDHVFAYRGGADFSLHNYTPIAGILGAPLIGTLGVVGALNVVMLASITLSGLGVRLGAAAE